MAELNADQQRLLTELTTHPAWEILREVCKQRMEREFNQIANLLMQGADISGVEIARRRGFFAGMKYLLDNPAIEQKKLERALSERIDLDA